ncbi:MAG: bifunctional nuclease family protein [Propionibacteriaceae bacterium]|nr:bifunctional nuclease family protein [Propionibacteriaceae bacterium]
MIDLDVIGIRLASPEDIPVLLLRESGGTRLLPIWISTVDAAAIAIVLDDSEQFHRPMTHDLLANVLDEVCAGKPGVVKITEMRDGVFFASVTAGDFVFDARPSDAIAAALRLEWSIECPEQLMDQVGVEVDESETDEVEKFREFLDTVTPDDFENENS